MLIKAIKVQTNKASNFDYGLFSSIIIHVLFISVLFLQYYKNQTFNHYESSIISINLLNAENLRPQNKAPTSSTESTKKNQELIAQKALTSTATKESVDHKPQLSKSSDNGKIITKDIAGKILESEVIEKDLTEKDLIVPEPKTHASEPKESQQQTMPEVATQDSSQNTKIQATTVNPEASLSSNEQAPDFHISKDLEEAIVNFDDTDYQLDNLEEILSAVDEIISPILVSNTQSLELSSADIQYLISEISKHWNLSDYSYKTQNYRTQILVKFNRDGSVKDISILDDPELSSLKNQDNDLNYKQFVNDAIRAVQQASPFSALSKENYEAWKEVSFTFEPNMFRY